MGLISYLRGDDLGQKALSGTPAVLEVLSQRRFNGYQSLGGTNLNRDRINGVYVAMQNSTLGAIYNLTPVVRKVVDYQAGQVAQLGLKLYERVDDDDRKQVGDHPAARSMRRPNPWTPGKKFIRGFVTNFLVYGNAYAVKFPDNQGFQLVEVSPAWVGIGGESHYQVDYYRIWRANGEYFDLPPENVVHWRGEDPDDPRRGTSKLETAREELAADAAARQANTELHRSGLALPGWIERPVEAPLITEEGLKRLRESLANQAKASRREYPILEEGMTFHPGGVTPEDAELLAARRWTSEEIAGLYGMFNVPPRTDEERRQFYSDVLPDITSQLAEFLTLQILREDYGLEDHYFEFNLDDKLMGDERIKTLTSAAGAPIMLRDEARAKLNLPALPDGQGEEIIVPANVTEGEGKPSIGVMPIQDPNGPPQDGSHRSGEADEPDRAGSRASLNSKELVELHKAPLVPRRRLASQRRDRWATEYWGVLDAHFKRQRRSLKSQRTKAVTDARWNTELADDLNVVARRQFEAEGKHVAFRLASTFDPDDGQNWLRVKSLRSAEAINRTTQEQMDELGLDKAFDHGETRAVAAGMAYATDVAAFSTRVAAEQAPGEPTIVIDGGECEICAPFQGAWPFGEVQWPSYHAHCFPAATLVSGPPVEGATRRYFEGEVVVLRFASGDFLTATPNHPVLTPDGFVPAGQLHEGSNVVRCLGKQGRDAGMDPDDDRSPALIGDVWESLSSQSGVVSARVPGSPEDFHGDGSDSEVHVVGANRLLRDDVEAALSQPVGQYGFGGGDAKAALLPGLGAKAAFFKRVLAATSGCVCGRSLASALLSAHPGRLEQTGLLSAPDVNAGLHQTTTYHDSLQAEPLRDGEFGFTGKVGGDDFAIGRVEAVMRGPFSGYVYNLQTEGGWYIANNTVVHNCNCVADVESAPFKAIPIETKAQEFPPITVNITLPSFPEIPEGVIQFKAGDTTVEASPPAQISMEAPQVNVAPAEVKFAKGAFEAPQVNVEAPPAPNVQVEAPHVTVAPAEVNFAEGAVAGPNVTVESPEVTVEVEGSEAKKVTKRVVRDPISKRITSIEEERE